MHLSMYEVSKLLDLPVSTVERWVRQGKIPVYKSEHGYIFLERELRQWATLKGMYLGPGDKGPDKKVGPADCSLLSSMKKGGTLHGIRGDGVSGVLQSIAHKAALDGWIDREELFRRLIEREELSTTGIGGGVAIPHPRSPLATGPNAPSITTCFLDEPLDYGSIDGIPVFVLFLMLSPSPKVHLTILGKLSHLLKDRSFVSFLKKKPLEKDLFSMVGQMEAKIDPVCRPSGLNHAL